MSQATTDSPPASTQSAVAPPRPEAAGPPRLSFKEEVYRFTERFGHMMSRVLLTVLYVVLVAPGGLLLTLFADGLGIRRWRGSSWVPWDYDNETLDAARRQD